MEDIEFTSAGQVCRGWRLVAPHDALDGRFGRPVVVMAHGIGGTIDSGLRPFADMLCAIGVDVVAFDYRGFGVSGGRPRQRVSMRCQIGDYHAAVEMAQRLPGIDRDRVVLWGVSLAGGHVINVAACRSDIAGVIALTPLVDGCAAAALALRHHSAGSMVRGATTSLKSAVATLRGADPVSMTLVARPGCAAALSLDGAYDRYTALAGPTWENRVDASIGVELLGYRPIRVASRIGCPSFFQIASADCSAPPRAAARAAAKARAAVRDYACDHFDVWPGGRWFTRVVNDQQAFLSRLFADQAG